MYSEIISQLNSMSPIKRQHFIWLNFLISPDKSEYWIRMYLNTRTPQQLQDIFYASLSRKWHK